MEPLHQQCLSLLIFDLMFSSSSLEAFLSTSSFFTQQLHIPFLVLTSMVPRSLWIFFVFWISSSLRWNYDSMSSAGLTTAFFLYSYDPNAVCSSINGQSSRIDLSLRIRQMVFSSLVPSFSFVRMIMSPKIIRFLTFFKFALEFGVDAINCFATG